MLRRTLLIAPFLILAAALPAGCRDSHARSAGSRPSSAATPGTGPGVSSTAFHNHAPSSFRHPVASADRSLYHNPDYGVSLRYPKTYLLSEELTSEDPSTLKSRPGPAEPLPGPILVVTISIPSDAYPNTTFRAATLQFVVNPTVTPEACQAFAAPEDDYFTSGSKPIQGITFNWRERGSAAAGTSFENRDYSAFANGACYEFYLEVVTGSNPDLDPRIKEADVPKILRHLDKIVLSLQIHHPPALPAEK